MIAMTEQIPFRRVAIHGVGLIGGSLGLALKKRYPQMHIRGVGRNPERLEIAQTMGCLDDFEPDLRKALGDRDLVVLATPVEHILQTLETLGEYLAPGTVVTDVGSTKRSICRTARRVLPSSVEFVGGHPVAGREVTGVESSLADLFQGASYVLCPRAGTGPEVLKRLGLIVEGVGARALIMEAEDHDRIIAWTSHLPQLVSTALANVASAVEAPENTLASVSGSGFRDGLRLAGSPYSVWGGIIETNDDNIDLALAAMIRELETMRGDLKQKRLSRHFDRAVNFYNSYRTTKEKK
jgi:prephenate dehydrogenase